MSTQSPIHRTDGPGGAEIPTSTAIDVRANSPVVQAEPAVGDLLKRLASDSGDLVRNELALAKLEVRDMARELAADSAKVGAALGLALAGGLVLLAAAVIGLGLLLGGGGAHYALSALILGGVMLLVGGLMARSGVAGLKNPPRPDETVRSVQETKAWAGREAREFKEEIRSS
ncbi:MAG TPA: phage holin family protein [Longimicrobiales bacterium]|nr:phage holin family protein [Longimicrobiales bacterium]